MKDFLDILLTSKEVVADQYNNIGKVIAGAEAKKILEDKTVITEAFDQKLIAAVYQGVANSMNARPDNGNSKFSNV
jgi:putative aminopeptidase FrvX